jgi:hypothetical protein
MVPEDYSYLARSRPEGTLLLTFSEQSYDGHSNLCTKGLCQQQIWIECSSKLEKMI